MEFPWLNRERIDGWLTVAKRDWPLKLAALVFALALWYLVAGRAQMERILEAPVFYRGLSSELVLLDPPTHVQATVRGPAQTIRRLQPQDLELSIDVAGIEPGERILTLNPNMISTAVSGVQVLHVQPPQLRLIVDRLTRKTVPVQPQLVGQLPEGYQITSVRVEPPQVLVQGPASLASTIENAVTETINIHMQRSSFRRLANVGLPDPRWHVVEPERVTVEVQIEEILEFITFRAPVDISQLPRGWRVRPEAVSVGLRVWYTKKDRIKFDQIRVVLPEDLPPLRRGVRVSVQVQWPDAWNDWIVDATVQPPQVVLVRH